MAKPPCSNSKLLLPTKRPVLLKTFDIGQLNYDQKKKNPLCYKNFAKPKLSLIKTINLNFIFKKFKVTDLMPLAFQNIFWSDKAIYVSSTSLKDSSKIRNLQLTFYSQSMLFFLSEIAQSCPTLCDPMDCNIPGSFIHGIFQARILEWVAISISEHRQV